MSEKCSHLLRDLDVGRRRRDHRNAVALRDRRRRERARRGVLADQCDHVIPRDELRHDRRSLGRLAPVILGKELDRFAEDSTGPVELVGGEPGAVSSGEAKVAVGPVSAPKKPTLIPCCSGSSRRRTRRRRRGREGLGWGAAQEGL